MPLKPETVSFVIIRLSDCPDLAALKRVWDSLNPALQHHPLIRETKDRLKADLS